MNTRQGRMDSEIKNKNMVEKIRCKRPLVCSNDINCYLPFTNKLPPVSVLVIQQQHFHILFPKFLKDDIFQT